MSCPSVSIPYHRLVSGLSVCLHTVSSPRVRQRRAAERRAATTAVGARERGAGAAAAAEERAVAGGVAAVFGIACALVKVLCGCRCHRGSVTIRPSPYHRLVRAAAPSSRTGSDCGGASERERGGGGRGGRRVAAAAAAAVRGEREATGGDGETAPIWITLSHRMLAPRNRGETTSATARLEHRTRGRGGGGSGGGGGGSGGGVAVAGRAR